MSRASPVLIANGPGVAARKNDKGMMRLNTFLGPFLSCGMDECDAAVPRTYHQVFHFD